MSSSALLRPGTLLGEYPQRADPHDSWLDRTASNLMGMIRRFYNGSSAEFTKLVIQVNKASEGLESCTEQELSDKVAALHKQLYNEGLKDELIFRCFALVREVSHRKLGMRHHDVQLYGGWVMLKGMVAEMETGEGKTLTATLPACTAALAGIPVHIVTVNDFLVSRDAQWMSPVYEGMGLTVGTVTESKSLTLRKEAYASNITYCTNKQLVFDYLKDRILLDQEDRNLHLRLQKLYASQPRTNRMLMRGLCFAIVDEADSVLIDEARTPLIVSNKGDINQEIMVYGEALKIASSLEHPRDFTLQTRNRQAQLTDFGRASVNRAARKLSGIWKNSKRREELVRQALAALHLYKEDKQYLVKAGKIQIIDEYTGRVMADRSWESGLHQMIECKEGCEMTARLETLARISYQKFFRRYLHLAGMTGTAREVTQELWAVYRLGVRKVPTNKKMARRILDDQVFLTAERKWQEIVECVDKLHQQNRPVLIGTRSVAASEHLSHLLTARGLSHRVLNARQDKQEAEIISEAGRLRQITVATNMAGRGTDIRLAPGITDLGGLHVLATERHDAGRIDRQLLGRAGRQGDPGSYQAIVSLEDELLKHFYGDRGYRIFSKLFDETRPLPNLVGRAIVWLAQVSTELGHSGIRKDLLQLDERLDDLLAFTGRGE